MRTELGRAAIVFAAATLAAFAVGCASAPKPRPTTIDPSNPAAPESAPLRVTPLGAGSSADAKQAPSSGPVDAGEQPAGPGGHPRDHSSGSPAAKSTTYTCPMHPEVVSDTPGTCPKCGMKLVPKPPEVEK